MNAKSIGLIVGMLGIAGIGYAISGNPTSNVLYDSAATAGNLVIRDTAGSSSFTQIGLTATTTTQLAATVPAAAGQLVAVSLLDAGAAGSNFTLCIASGTTTGAWIYLSTNTTTGAGGSAKPRPCI